MPKVSQETASKVTDFGLGVDREERLDGYTISFVTVRESHSLAEFLKGLPGDRCHCPHWGFLFKGRLTVRYGEEEEVIEAGNAFYMPPGHVPAAEAGSEFVQFSPSEELDTTMAAIQKNMQAMHGA
jgi:hypothetical protein